MVKGITVVLLIVYAIGGLFHGSEVLAGHAAEVAAAGNPSVVERHIGVPLSAGATHLGNSPALAVLDPMSRVPAPAVLGQITITAGSAAVFERNMVQPPVATLPRPLAVPQFTIIQGTAALLDRATTGPNISAQSRPLNVTQFTIIQGTAALLDRATTGPNIPARSRPLNVTQFIIIQGTAALLDRATTGPNIAARSRPLSVQQFTIIQGTAAVLDRATTGPNIAARSRPLSVQQFTIIQGTAAVLDRTTTGPNIAARSQPLAVPQFTIIQGTAATFQRGLFDPLTQDANILSTGRGVRLQGTPGDSSGAFLRANGRDHFVRADGSFSFSTSPGALTIEIMAPGYLSMNVTSPSGPDIFLDSEAVLAIPELRLMYGDANGNGVINSKDITLGSRNFGATSLALPLTATQQEPPTGDAIIRNRSGIHLQGSPTDTTGAFLRVNGQDHFVAADGRFSITVDPGSFAIQIRAPGYLPVDIVSPSGSSILFGSGDVLTVPELTMVYGDANGDGLIDVNDLATGASNFGQTSGQLQVAPQ